MPRPRLDGQPSRKPLKRNLTELFVGQIKPQERPFLVWDLRQHGLAIQVHPSGNKNWKCIYARHGRPRWYSLGKGIDLADARRLAARIMLKVAEGGDPQADRVAQRKAGTFDELADAYLEQHAKLKHKSWKQADALVRNHLRPRWGKLPAGDIGRADVRSMLRAIESPTTANQTVAAASAIFSWAIKEEIGGMKVHPCRGIEHNPTVTRERVLSDSEIASFWSAFDDAGLIRGHALKLLLLTGQRPGEVAHMRREHLSSGWWTMPGEPDDTSGWPGTKNGKTHRVWLPSPAQTLIADLDGEGFILPSSRGRAVTGLSEAMQAICQKLGAERATPHDLRRTHGTTVTGLGFGRDAMNRIQNHAEGGIADVYDRHDYADENRRIMEAVAARILSLVEGPVENNISRPTFKR